MHRRLAAWAVRVIGFDRHIHARQMGRKRATIAAALLGTRAPSHRVLLVVVGVVCRDGLFDILERQIKLLRIKLLRTTTKLCTPQLMQEMPHAVILRPRLVTFSNGQVTRS